MAEGVGLGDRFRATGEPFEVIEVRAITEDGFDVVGLTHGGPLDAPSGTWGFLATEEMLLRSGYWERADV